MVICRLAGVSWVRSFNQHFATHIHLFFVFNQIVLCNISRKFEKIVITNIRQMRLISQTGTSRPVKGVNVYLSKNMNESFIKCELY